MNDLLSLFIIAAFLIMVLIGLYQATTATGIILTFLLLCIVSYFIVYIY